jgi:protein O-GlcNAc transferase
MRVGGDGRIRIGYVSPDYRMHPSAFLMQPIFELHDRTRFEIYGYSLMKSDGSEIRRRIESTVDVFRDESGAFDVDIADRISADHIDVLVDLAGYTNFSRAGIFARRPAPLQVSYLGFPGTLGADYIDYALVDRTVCPAGAERHWIEKPVYLPNCYFAASNRDRAAARPASRASTGLPDSALVLCCFNNAHKVEPVMFSIWMRALRANPDAVLWLFANDARVQENLRREAESRGIGPSRLRFAPYWTHERHLGRLSHADLMVDTLYYNAHTTALDALGAGVPVLTCPGPSMPSRVAASLLKAIDMPDLITRDLAEYEQRLLFLGQNRAELQKLRLKLKENYDKTPLFDTEGFVRDLESAFVTMVERYRAGLPAEAFDVSAAKH